MAKSVHRRRPAPQPAAIDLHTELVAIGMMKVEELRALWQQRRGEDPPPALSKDLIARALAYWLQEEHLGGLDPRMRKLLLPYSGKDLPRARHVKVGSIIVREHQGKIHEVMVVPDGFCWQGQIYGSLSTIARKITGTSWNGPRFFGLRSAGESTAPDSVAPAAAVTRPLSRSRSVRGRGSAHSRGGAP